MANYGTHSAIKAELTGSEAVTAKRCKVPAITGPIPTVLGPSCTLSRSLRSNNHRERCATTRISQARTEALQGH